MTDQRPAFDDLPSSPAVDALRALDVPEDVERRHLARLAALGAPGVVPLRPRRTALRAGAAGLVFGATLVTGAGVAAAGSAQPGDSLYGVKTARERLQLALARPGDSRARLELKLARTRLGEAAALLRDGETVQAIETLARADAALASAGAHGDDEVDREVAGELDRRVEVLTGLLDGGLPDQAAAAAREAIERAVSREGRAVPAKPATPRPRPENPVHTPHPSKVRPTDRPSAPPSARPGTPSSDRPTGRPADRPGGPPTANPGRGR